MLVAASWCGHALLQQGRRNGPELHWMELNTWVEVEVFIHARQQPKTYYKKQHHFTRTLTSMAQSKSWPKSMVKW